MTLVRPDRWLGEKTLPFRLGAITQFRDRYWCSQWLQHMVLWGPNRGRSKGKNESSVGYLKHDAVAGRSLDSFEALEAHIAAWIGEVVRRRVHATKGEAPIGGSAWCWIVPDRHDTVPIADPA